MDQIPFAFIGDQASGAKQAFGQGNTMASTMILFEAKGSVALELVKLSGFQPYHHVLRSKAKAVRKSIWI